VGGTITQASWNPRDLDRPSALRGEYLDRSIELRNEFVTMMGWQFKGLV
jgi:hypothetical protein